MSFLPKALAIYNRGSGSLTRRGRSMHGRDAFHGLQSHGNRRKSLNGCRHSVMVRGGEKRGRKVHSYIPLEFTVSSSRKDVVNTFRTTTVEGMWCAFGVLKELVMVSE